MESGTLDVSILTEAPARQVASQGHSSNPIPENHSIDSAINRLAAGPVVYLTGHDLFDVVNPIFRTRCAPTNRATAIATIPNVEMLRNKQRLSRNHGLGCVE
jgi:hypothetical protein